MYTARKARTVGPRSRETGEGQRFVTATAGALFGKAHALSEEVHRAMVSRGYSGDAKTLDPPGIRSADAIFMAAVILFAVLTLGGDHVLGG